MKITAKYYINNYKLYTEDMKLVGQIRKNLTHAKQLSVLNASGDFFVQIEQKNDHIFLNYNDGSVEDTQLQYQQRTSLLQPPMACALTLDTKWGDLSITQTPHREFEVSLEHQEIAFLTRMTGITKEIHVLDDTIPTEFFSIIFTLAFLMLHDDDIEIV